MRLSGSVVEEMRTVLENHLEWQAQCAADASFKFCVRPSCRFFAD